MPGKMPDRLSSSPAEPASGQATPASPAGSAPSRDQTARAAAILDDLQRWARELGFSQIGVTGIDLHAAEPGLVAWLNAGFHGGMAYMAAHGLKRARTAELVPGTVRVITASMDYLPNAAADDWRPHEWQALSDPEQAVISTYARGRDYHKVLRQRLQRLADRLTQAVGPLGYRVFTDSAPVLEAELATRSGLGWRGKHTLVLNRQHGSMFFLGEIFIDLPLPLTEPEATTHCGTCTRCLDVCPTRAIVAPYRLDARRCISYLTIEHDGPIPLELRPHLGNRIYGCDDCQLACPWNKYAQRSPIADFDVRSPLDRPRLLTLWAWSEADFLRATEGSAIRRIGFVRWQRNLAVALGNALASGELQAQTDAAMREALSRVRPTASALLAEHIDWALGQRPAAGEKPCPPGEGSAAPR
jgi:epoxyqueuosine reductase